MTNLLQLCQFVARDIGVLVPLSVINNPDATAAGLLAQASRACRRVWDAIDWPLLMREHTFSAVDTQEEYDLPSDFGRFIDGTAWDRTQYWDMRGPLSPQSWQASRSGLIAANGLQKRWRVKRSGSSISNKFTIDPIPSDTNSLVFEYISNSWATASDGTTLRTDWQADTDILLIDDDLVELDMTWRMLRRLNMPFDKERQEADSQIDISKTREGGAPTISVTGSVWNNLPFIPPETGYGS